MPSQNTTEQFVQLLTASQTRLFAFIFMLLGDDDAASDVLQETNLVLWRKSGEYVEGTDFFAWASSVARFQAMAHQRDSRRDRHRFNDELIEKIAESAEQVSGEVDARQKALRSCMKKLTRYQRELVEARYSDGTPIGDIAELHGRTYGSVAMTLSRVRQMLFDCIRERLADERDEP